MQIQGRTFASMQPVSLSEPELVEFGKKLGEAVQNLKEIEEEKRRVTKEYADKCTAQEFVVQRLAEIQRTGKEERPVDCYWNYHDPAHGEKTMWRTDTGEVVEVCAMTERDFEMAEQLTQLELPL